MEDINITNNSLYICHFCLYKTTKKCDIKRHIDKKTKCQLMYVPKKMISREESNELSLNNRFFLLFDYKNLLFEDYIYIVNNFNQKINYIQYQDIIKNNPYLEKNMDETLNNITDINENEEINESKEEEEKKFVCSKCNKKYKYKKDLINHIKNKTICENEQILNSMLKDTNINGLQSLISESTGLQGIVNSFNQSNINVQNNYNNSPAIKLEVKDFGCESYSYSHLKPSFFKQNDFYLYTNFLDKLLENQENQNLLFMKGNEDIKPENRKAIIYADEILYKINEDKAVYMVLSKLNITMRNLLSNVYKNDSDKEKIEEIQRYYRVITGHFKHDTLYKNYHIDDKEYYYPAHRRRSRDVYSAKIKNIVHNHGTPLSQVTNNDQNIALETFYPDIEDYASTRVRNKDLKKRKDELLF